MPTITHGVFANVLPTLARITQIADADVPVIVGLAPVHRLVGGAAQVNQPFLCLDQSSTLAALNCATPTGMVQGSDWKTWTLNEAFYVVFTLFNAFNKPSPVFVNVFNPLVHSTPVAAAQLVCTAGVIAIPFATADVVIDSVVVKNTAGTLTLTKGVNYITGYDQNSNFLITILDPNPTTTYTVSYSKANPAAVTATTIIGGTDANNNNSGLSVINDVFPKLTIVPGILYAPGYMQQSLVATAADALVQAVNGIFKARVGPVEVDNPATAKSPTGAVAFKSTNSIVDSREDLVWPPICVNGPLTFHAGLLITILEGVVTQNPAQGNGVPYWSVSNNLLPITGIQLSDGTLVSVSPNDATYLNSNGIITLLQWEAGWFVWGDRTAAYPLQNDVTKVYQICQREIDWLCNTMVLTLRPFVDNPTNQRLIQVITLTAQLFYSSLVSAGALLEGKIEFLQVDNPLANLMQAKIVFHHLVTTPLPAETIQNNFEFDVAGLNLLFQTVQTVGSSGVASGGGLAIQ